MRTLRQPVPAETGTHFAKGTPMRSSILLLALLPLACTSSETSPGGLGPGGSAGAGPVASAGAGGAAGEHCTYQGIGASDPIVSPLECPSVAQGLGWYRQQLCVVGDAAVFVSAICGGGYYCVDSGDLSQVEASVDPSFGAVTSAKAIGMDRQGVEVVIQLASGAPQTASLSFTGTFDGIEGCRGAPLSCPVAATAALDLGASNCANLAGAYYSQDTPAAELAPFLGAAGGGP
jgi:hypothetical protein